MVQNMDELIGNALRLEHKNEPATAIMQSNDKHLKTRLATPNQIPMNADIACKRPTTE